MTNTLVLYSLNDKAPSQKTRIIKALYGYTDKSCHSKYTYQRKGLLTGIPYERRTKTALKINKKDEMKVVQTLRKFGIKPIIINLPR